MKIYLKYFLKKLIQEGLDESLKHAILQEKTTDLNLLTVNNIGYVQNLVESFYKNFSNFNNST